MLLVCHKVIQVMDIAGVSQGDSGIGLCWCVTRQVKCWTLLVCHRVSQALDVAGVTQGKPGVGHCLCVVG